MEGVEKCFVKVAGNLNFFRKFVGECTSFTPLRLCSFKLVDVSMNRLS